MDLILVLIGAALATLGGFIQQKHQNMQDQKRNDKNILIKTLDILLAMLKPAKVSILASETWEKLSESMHKSADKSYGFTSALYRLSFEFQRKESADIANKIRQFASRPGMQGINELKEEIEERIRNG